jgi:uncharacterized membrane protein
MHIKGNKENAIMPDARGDNLSRVGGWLFDQPYLLLALTSLFWAGNTVLGRFIAGHVPPITLAFIRWGGAFLILLPFAVPHLKRDWPAIRKNAGLLTLIAFTGFSVYNTMAYYGLQYTTAISGLLLQSVEPLFVAMWTFVLFGDRLTLRQAGGIGVSLGGVLVIVCHGSLGVLLAIEFNCGDVCFVIALVIYGFYAAFPRKRPAMHPFSFLAVGRRRNTARSGSGLGNRQRPHHGIRRRKRRELHLHLHLSIIAWLSVPQPRHRADRRQPCRAVHTSCSGIWFGAGNRAAWRAVRALSRRRLRPCVQRHHDCDETRATAS